jgi:hypothetical protein
MDSCREGLIVCEIQRKWSYLDPDGQTVLSVPCTAAGHFSEGLATVLKKGLMGYIDKTGVFAIPPQFAQAGDFQEGLAAVEFLPAGKQDFTKPQVFGFVDHQGRRAIAADFLLADEFSEGLAAVNASSHRKFSYIDQQGATIIPEFTCESAGPFQGGLACFQIAGGRYGYLGRNGDVVWKP